MENSNEDEGTIHDSSISIEKSDDEHDSVDTNFLDTYQRLKQKDQTLSHLWISLKPDEIKYFFDNIDWKEVGDCISDNEHLKKLFVAFHDEVSPMYDHSHRLQLRDFFSCVYRSSSINQIHLSSTCILDEFGGSLIEGLCGHSSLTTLEITGHGRLGRNIGGLCNAIGRVLNDPRSYVKDLRLYYCEFDDNRIRMLFNSLLGNSTLKRLYFWHNGITFVGLRSLAKVIRDPRCKLSKLSLRQANINDEGGDILGRALCGSSVKDLDLSDNRSITSAGWQRLLNNHLAQVSLVRLDLGGNEIDNSSGISALANIGTLQSLHLGGNNSITPIGWRTFFNAYSNLNLVHLRLDENRIDDNGIQALTRLVSRMSSLRSLTLGSNRSVTPTGWQALTDYLQSPNFALKQLDLDDNDINDDIVITFTRALVHNNTLKLIDLHRDPEDFDDDDMITERGWRAVSTLLCNNSSIMDTYNSHHILKALANDYNNDEMNLPDNLVSLLELNRNKDKVEVARQKILQTHFSGTTNFQEFLDMELEIMPTAISWIGRLVPQIGRVQMYQDCLFCTI